VSFRFAPSTRERDALDDHVEAIMAALAEMPPAFVQAIGTGLSLSGSSGVPGGLSHLGTTFQWWSGEPSTLMHLRLRSFVEWSARDEALLERLETAESPPWPQVKRALAHRASSLEAAV
jgi:hypothetical protein